MVIFLGGDCAETELLFPPSVVTYCPRKSTRQEFRTAQHGTSTLCGVSWGHWVAGLGWKVPESFTHMAGAWVLLSPHV